MKPLSEEHAPESTPQEEVSAPEEVKTPEKKPLDLPPWLAPGCTLICTVAKIISDWLLRGHH